MQLTEISQSSMKCPKHLGSQVLEQLMVDDGSDPCDENEIQYVAYTNGTI
jgi:hypothetical protein